MKILVLNGPNLNLLGTREPEVYGSTTLEELDELVNRWGSKLGIAVEAFQTNHEGAMVDQIQRGDVDGIVINPAAYSYTSRAITDAIAAVDTPVVEVHISNIKEREPWRANSLVTEVADYTIYGRGIIGYRDAIRHLASRLSLPFETVPYATGPDQVGDLRRGNDTMVVLLHGGFWMGQWTRDTMESLAIDLGNHGVTTWNVEYRRLGGGGGWPESADDVLVALDHAAGLAGTTRTIVLGHSAGGFMGMWAAQKTQVPVARVVALAPIIDLAAHAGSGLFAADIAQGLLDQGAPPVIDPGVVPTTVVHGRSDTHVPIAHSEALESVAGVDLITTEEGHFELLDPTRAPWPEVRELIAG